MDLTIIPSILHGHVTVPSSKSITHRALICAALAHGESEITNVSMSQDINATIESLTALGASFRINGSTVKVTGISHAPACAKADCCESGSTLRFLIPVACALGTSCEFSGQGRLASRPIDIYIRELSDKGIQFSRTGTMPFSVNGKLSGGRFNVEGNVSSQFITGFLLALPLLSEDSEIILTSELESKPYVDITIGCLKHFGIEIVEKKNSYFIRGGQNYKPADFCVEADFSQAAFFIAAGFIGNDIVIDNLPDASLSLQGDKKIIEITQNLCYNYKQTPFFIDASDIPDLVPVLAVACSLSKNETHITNAGRLRIKESDRLVSTSEMINSLGGKVRQTDDGLIISPVSCFTGGIVDSCNDHRIAMAAAVAATRSTKNVSVKNFDAIKKSYPDFLDDYKKIGGLVKHGITLE
ncbi:MAG: 3-phosphoshikimate 1-carboxyvinyltransferase [Oscillospiraceae bacterium]|nr:3-phosphoshikimate 1-carboxyvinyltransferase [Oscillospiraceae bacterium]